MRSASPRRHPRETAFLAFDQHKCKACWRCVEACPRHVMAKVSVLWHKHAVLRRGGDCIGCYKCVALCEAGALTRRQVAA